MANTENAGSTADVPPVRYRVSGMDCAKDAAQIERAAQAAGVAPGDVKVSAATPADCAARSICAASFAQSIPETR